MRIARACTLRPAYLNESVALLKLFGHLEEMATNERAREELTRLMVRDGLIVEMAKHRGKVTEDVGRVAFKGASAPAKPNMTALLETYFKGETSWLYALLSGVAHAKGGLLEGISDDVDEAIRARMMPLLAISEVYSNAWCAYFDLDPKPFRIARNARLMALARTGGQVLDGGLEVESAFGTHKRTLIGGLRPLEASGQCVAVGAHFTIYASPGSQGLPARTASTQAAGIQNLFPIRTAGMVPRRIAFLVASVVLCPNIVATSSVEYAVRPCTCARCSSTALPRERVMPPWRAARWVRALTAPDG